MKTIIPGSLVCMRQFAEILMTLLQKSLIFFYFILPTVVVFGVMAEYIFVPLVPILLDVFMPLNESRPKKLMIIVDYGVNIDDNYFLICIHTFYSCVAIVTVFLSIDGIFIIFVYHACGQLAILG